MSKRLDATALYFARPGDGAMGECGTYYWMSQEVTAINQFHNAFIGASEHFSMSNGYLVGERYREGDNKRGVIITNISNASANATISNVSVSYLNDGTYYDQITGNEFIVKDHKVSGEMGKSGIVVLHEKEVSIKPQIFATQSAKYFFEGAEATLKLDVKNATNVTYSINNGDKISVATDGTITVNTACKITIYATGDKEVSQSYEFKTVAKREGYWCVAGVNTQTLEENSIYAWVWGNGSEGKWREVEIVDGVAYVKQQPKDYGMLLAFFDKGASINQIGWSSSPAQTADFGKPLKDNVVYCA